VTLERLRIRNYQRHERLEVELDPRVTAVVGPSDAGKSSVLRALRWVTANRPLGDGFVREGADKASVQVRVDGKNVVRKKGKGENLYKVGKKELKAFGADVPEDVQRVLNLGDANFQGQHDPPFWFCLTPGELARRLNDIVDLGLIDESQSRVASRLRSLRAEEKVVRERLEKAEEEAGRLEFVGRLAEDLKGLEEHEEYSSRLAARAARLGEVVAEVSEQGERAKRLAEAASGAERACLAGEEWESSFRRHRALADLLEEVEETKKGAERRVPDLGPLEELRKEGEKTKVKWARLSALIDQIESEAAAADWRRERLKEAEDELEGSLEGRCPLCGSEASVENLL
jgi:exonuclease SbcC